MFLQELKINNIRSYQEEKIIFPKGTTLLSGDIGSGKSSILLAIEFALFGSSHSNLSAESLLRKGCNDASVELSFTIENKQISIKRCLKKSSTGIKQTNGHIIINQKKLELTPTELKAEIVCLLGYPEELATKSKNYIFRYTVYCPQEEMKEILLEDPDKRLDILRKIFKIDKYKIIRENMHEYLKGMRKELAILNTKIEPIEEIKNNIKQIKEKIDKFDNELVKINSSNSIIKSRINKIKQDITKFELLEKEYLNFKIENETKSSLLIELKNNLNELSIKEKKVGIKIKELFLDENLNEEKINIEIKDIEIKKNNFLEKKNKINNDLNLFQNIITSLQKEIKILELQTEKFADKTEQISKIKVEIKNKESYIERKNEIEELINTSKDSLTKHIILKNNSLNIINKLLHLEECPTCLQDVRLEYKQNLISKEREKINHSEQQILEQNQKIEILRKNFKKCELFIEKITCLEKKHSILELEIINIKEKQERILKLRKELQENVIKNNQTIKTLEELTKTSEFNFKRINDRLNTLHQFLQKLSLKQELKNQKINYTSEIQTKSEKKVILENEIKTINLSLQNINFEPEKINKHRIILEDLIKQDKNISIEKIRTETDIKHLNQKCFEQKENFNKLSELKNKLIKKRELYNWLNKFFIQLTYTIEKDLLLRIYHQFNELFREWFSILVEDDQISSRLDDSFTPIIEQNGYEISFPHLSGGERTAVSLAYRLALNKVINDVIHQIKTKNLLILDEPTDGFSSEQLEKMHDLIDALDLSQILIVSHETKVESFVDNTINVTKSEHISRCIGQI